jgi:hypothetical protein
MLVLQKKLKDNTYTGLLAVNITPNNFVERELDRALAWFERSPKKKNLSYLLGIPGMTFFFSSQIHHMLFITTPTVYHLTFQVHHPTLCLLLLWLRS